MARVAGSGTDVLVVGAGPAGWAAAAALAAAGARTKLVAPDPFAVWPQTYCCWEGDLPAGLAGGPMPAPARRWQDVTVVGDRRQHVGGGRATGDYVQLDNRALHAGCAERFSAAGGEVVSARVDRFERGGVVLDDERRLTGGLVLDATGATAGRAAQTAYGVVARFDEPPGPPGHAVLMDWSCWRGDERRPSFLYALDRGDGWWLVEETSLAADPPLPIEVLEARLQERLARRGTPAGEIDRVERVCIPLDAPVPRHPPGTAAIGAAGGLVHPATGYSVAASLRVAVALGTACEGGATLAELGRVARACRAPVVDRLRLAGLGVVIGLDQAGCRQFFDTFFGLADRDRQRFLGSDRPLDLLRGGAALFAHSPRPMQRRLLDPRALSRGRGRAGCGRGGRAGGRGRTTG